MLQLKQWIVDFICPKKVSIIKESLTALCELLKIKDLVGWINELSSFISFKIVVPLFLTLFKAVDKVSNIKIRTSWASCWLLLSNSGNNEIKAFRNSIGIKYFTSDKELAFPCCVFWGVQNWKIKFLKASANWW